GGFIIHHLLPMRQRRKFFLALSIAGIVAVLPFPHSLVLLAVGLGLIGLCHLPISLRARVILIALAGTGLARPELAGSAVQGWTSFSRLSCPALVACSCSASPFIFTILVTNRLRPHSLNASLTFSFYRTWRSLCSQSSTIKHTGAHIIIATRTQF